MAILTIAALYIAGATLGVALVGGTWFPVTHGFLHDLGQCVPSYWLAQADTWAPAEPRGA